MPSPRILARLVSTAANISAGALLARRDPSRCPEPVPPIVGELLTLITETTCVAARPGDPMIQQADARLSALVERYGTMRLALEALAAGGRQHAGISHEKAHAWAAIMLTSVAQIDSVLRRSPTLMLAIGKWIAAQGDTLEARLDAYQTWLDSEVSDDPWRSTGVHASSEQSLGIELPRTDAGDDEIAGLQRALIDDKRVLDPITPPGSPGSPGSPGTPGTSRAPTTSDASRMLADRLATDSRPLARCMSAIAQRRFKDADSILPSLRGSIAEHDLWSLWGERYYFDGRFEEAVEAFESARGARDDLAARRNLAAAHLRASKPATEVHVKSAIDLLSETVRTLVPGDAERPILEVMLGAAWLRHTGGDRDADFRRAIEHLESAVSNLDQQAAPQWWAEAHVELGIAWLGLPSGKQLENVQRAVTCFERAMLVWTREQHPERWALVQNHLGHAWERLPAGERRANLDRAISCYEAAAEVKSRDGDPVGWAMLQNNLGNAWVQMPGGDHRADVLRAVECHQAALEVWSSHNRRSEWAATQNNLGIALSMLPADPDERERNLRRAISAYKSALEVRSRAAHPHEWASTQNNLGSTYLHLPPGPDGANLREAVACFERALEVRSRDALPIDWAKTQANLGNAWMRMPGDRITNLQHAVECYSKALVVFTRSSHPHQHEHIAQRKAEAMDLLDDMQIMGKG